MTTLPDRKEIEVYGAYIKTVNGICKAFAWKVYDYKGERYQVSQFDEQVNHVARVYCTCCGRVFLPSKIKVYLGLQTCVYCIAKS